MIPRQSDYTSPTEFIRAWRCYSLGKAVPTPTSSERIPGEGDMRWLDDLSCRLFRQFLAKNYEWRDMVDSFGSCWEGRPPFGLTRSVRDKLSVSILMGEIEVLLEGEVPEQIKRLAGSFSVETRNTCGVLVFDGTRIQVVKHAVLVVSNPFPGSLRSRGWFLSLGESIHWFQHLKRWRTFVRTPGFEDSLINPVARCVAIELLDTVFGRTWPNEMGSRVGRHFAPVPTPSTKEFIPHAEQ